VIVATGVHEFDAAFVGGANLDEELKARWTDMVSRVKTVPTKAAQVWLDKSVDELGWSRGSGIYTALGEGFDAYADMSHVLASEAWAGGGRPPLAGMSSTAARSLAYFCGPMPDSVIAEAKQSPFTGDDNATFILARRAIDMANAPDAVALRVAQDLDVVLRTTMSSFWPNLEGAKLRYYVQANHEGSERYTLSLPGSLEARLSPLEVEIANMTVAGDWTACGLDCGCVEAAVMSGLLAATAISGKPKLEDIVGYDHP
jgi:uncharacterized protein with NAD-binding domain and iron-sulfur cluster